MNLFTTNEQEQIKRNVELILSTVKGSVPLNRDFGLDISFVDMPTAKVAALARKQIYEQVKKYEPRATIKSISFKIDEIDGIVKPKVEIK